ncbi:hypothetical protein FB567DRAFT_495759 [Paraphoma chrysanthemicola]|uniref:BZIP domain-containing protein n=1 Tax=Paraphoma chrysanthemicola TaxID=798071 RepID=A0A8K0VYY5_9PLEO|nr:hypothetical protein FB567DRAFT_495759 [Paraphoma chrysanthemicola]
MSKKDNDTSTSARIRDNQRRSRNRRKELIEDLQRRVRDYELKGIEATQDMQRAARRVANENVGLRTLLAQRGVTAVDVDAFLQAFNNGEVISIARSTIATDPASVPVAAQCVTPETTSMPPPNSGLEISCETAAAIIIDMRGDGDIEAVRASLGCKGREACTVRNSTVLQIMDER